MSEIKCKKKEKGVWLCAIKNLFAKVVNELFPSADFDWQSARCENRDSAGCSTQDAECRFQDPESG